MSVSVHEQIGLRITTLTSQYRSQSTPLSPQESFCSAIPQISFSLDVNIYFLHFSSMFSSPVVIALFFLCVCVFLCDICVHKQVLDKQEASYAYGVLSPHLILSSLA